MSVSVMRAEGVTVLTVTSDGDTNCPLICQILRLLCSCPRPNGFRKGASPQGHSQSVLGALQIMIGVLTIGLGTVLSGEPFFIVYGSSYFEVMFIIAGITGILSERFYNSCLVVLSTILNLCGVALALTIIVLSSIMISNVPYYSNPCEGYGNSEGYWDWHQTTTLSPDTVIYLEKCNEGRALQSMLRMSVSIMSTFLSCLELCVVISSATLNIKACKKGRRELNKPQEPEPERTNTDPTL